MGTTRLDTAGSMGATRCRRCCRTTEFHVVLARRTVLGAIPLERRYAARCTACGDETPLSAAAARRVLAVRASCELRPAQRPTQRPAPRLIG
jgi:hypothetical protein